MDKKLADRRQEIDAIDHQIVDLLHKRAGLALKVGKLKESGGLPLFSAVSEEKVFAEVAAGQAGAFPKDALRAVFTEIISGCRSIQGANRVAVLGEKYSVTHAAALRMFGTSSSLVPIEYPEKLVPRLNQGDCALAILPIHSGMANSALLFDELLTGRMSIVSETLYHPRFVLASRHQMRIPDITKIFLTREVFSQIRPWVLNYSFQVKFTHCLIMEEVVENLVDTQKVAGVLPLEIARSLDLHIPSVMANHAPAEAPAAKTRFTSRPQSTAFLRINARARFTSLRGSGYRVAL